MPAECGAALQEFLARFEEAFAMETSSDAWREPPRGVVHHPQPGAAPDQDAQYGYNLAALMPGHCIGLRVTQTEPQLSDLTFTTRLNIVANPPKGAKAFRAPGKAISDANIANEEALCRVICAKISRFVKNPGVCVECEQVHIRGCLGSAAARVAQRP